VIAGARKFFSSEFSKEFVEILEDVYDNPETANFVCGEAIYLNHIKELNLYNSSYSKRNYI